MTKIGETFKNLRYPIAYLNGLEKDDVIHQDDIDRLRAEGRIVEPRKKEVRYIIGTTLIPHFAYKNASKNEMTTEAIALKFLIEKTIKTNTISKKQYDDAIVQAEKEEQDRVDAEKIKEIKTTIPVTKKSTKVTKKTTAKK